MGQKVTDLLAQKDIFPRKNPSRPKEANQLVKAQV